jgi:hypothetical protein
MNRFYALVHGIADIRALDLHLLKTPFRIEYYFRTSRYSCIPIRKSALSNLAMYRLNVVKHHPAYFLLRDKSIGRLKRVTARASVHPVR